MISDTVKSKSQILINSQWGGVKVCDCISVCVFSNNIQKKEKTCFDG